MRLLLMCDAQVGEAIADYLFREYEEDIGAVVTICRNSIYDAAVRKNIPALIYETEAQLVQDLAPLRRFDLGVLAWWPKLITTKVISLTNAGFVNTHPSLLPYNRGKHYNFWALVEEAPFGVTIHFVDEGIDSGDIVAQREIYYDWEDNAETLYLKAGKNMIECFKETYPIIRSDRIERKPQDLRKGSLHYAKEIDPASRIELDRTYTARELLNKLRARTFSGHPACRFEEDGVTYEVTVDIKRMST